MLKHSGGQRVSKGTYWNLSTGQRINVTGEEVLPGDRTTTYYRMPSAGVLVLAPFIGLAYAVFLPFIGIAMMVKLVVQRMFGGAVKTAGSSASFGWRPQESYLSGKKKGSKEDGKDKPEEKKG
ncbi:MAG TPA: hypothetical protein VF790_09120 [Dissulfurispiraceae bacterium]